MSWAEEDWTVGLSGRVLQKVKELQVHKERLFRENKQKQLQLDNIHASLEKQIVKYEEVRGECQCLQRELQSVREEAESAATSRDRLTQELHTKQAQVCSLEGQLDTARTLNNKLTQEVKRLEAELENLQNSSRPTDTTLFSTPSWNATSPWDHNGSRQEDRSGQRDERWSRGQHIRQQLQFSDAPTSSSPQVQHKSTPHRHPSHQSDIFCTPSAGFSWEQEDSRPTSRRRQHPSPQTPDTAVVNRSVVEQEPSGKKDQSDASFTEIQSRVAALEAELSAKVGALNSIESRMEQTKKELSAKELSLQKARDELSLAHARMAQESERASANELKLKQVQEELKCQRQNAESSRLHHQQRTKELEKQHQRDLTELQKERQCLEKQHQQEANKLNQELQQAMKLHNALQAQLDKLSLQKQVMDKDLEALKEKLKWTEEQLKDSQKKETQTQTKLMEAVREAEGVAVSLEQSRKRERTLEEEGRRLKEEQADTLRLLKELQEQKSASASSSQPVQVFHGGQSLAADSSSTHPPRASTHREKRSAPQAEQKKEDVGVNERRGETSASYPPDREPGEGIDAEHIADIRNSECSQRVTVEENKEVKRSENVAEHQSGTEKSLHSPSGMSNDGLIDSASLTRTLTLSEAASSPHLEQAASSEDLKRENSLLRSELHDARDELQRRLEDLETQRRAESEAKTRLKQLSRKHASQTVEREEKEKEWRTQLEKEKVETERLRKEMTALEAEISRIKKERDLTEKRRRTQQRMTGRLKNQLAEVKAQLALEREERRNEENEKNQLSCDLNKDLSIQLAELKAELEALKHGGKSSQEEEKVPVVNSPLTYLTLHDDELNLISHDEKLLSSPEQHRLFCRSANQLNMLLSTATADFLQQDQTLIDAQYPPLGEEDQSSQVDVERVKLNYEKGLSSSDLQESELLPSDPSKEVKRLQSEKAKETQRANQYQVKLEALQKQVTRQTQHLTTAFERQSQHISGLLAELQEKENAYVTQEKELQLCKEELAALRAEKSKKLEMTTQGGKEEEERDEREEEEGVETVGSQTHPNLNSANEASQPKIQTGEAEVLTPSSSSVNLDTSHTSACELTESSRDRHEASELLTVRQENPLLEPNTGASDQRERTDEEPKEDANGQNLTAEPNVLISEQHLLQEEAGIEDGEEREDCAATGGGKLLKEVSEEQREALQLQVEALQRKIRALSEETQQQAQELAVWRLASQPASALHRLATNTDDECGSWDELTHMQTQTEGDDEAGQHQVMVVREDELSLCCSSNRFRGHMLVSRLQNIPELKTLHSCETTRSPQEVRPAEELNLLDVCPAQHTEKKNTELLQMSSQKLAEQHIAEDQRDVSKPNPSPVVHCCSGKPDANSNSPGAAADVNNTSSLADKEVKTAVRSVSSQTEESLCRQAAPAVCASTQTEEDSVEPPASSVPGPEAEEDTVLFSGSFPIPADPARLAERIRRNRTQLSAAFDDTEYEPYGLPEVVMKGFADIPSGTSCPYIVRRGLLGTSVVPMLQKDSPKEEETD
ncbi:Centromere protein F [Oryzias melastigma]|uniref:Centromere protein F n=1 Tax=Oryzias melastigma TaxID=30732 RepID=A0A834CDI0_ORYME|nr:Centromere protein F [Oryzias melastigma]